MIEQEDKDYNNSPNRYSRSHIQSARLALRLIATAGLLGAIFSHPLRIKAESVDIGVYPPAIQVIASPGASLRVPVKIINYAHRQQDIAIGFLPFTKTSTLGIPLYHSPSIATQSSFIQLLRDGERESIISLNKEEQLNLEVAISIPREEAEKDIYQTILLTTSKDSQSNLSASYLHAGLGINLLLSIIPQDKSLTQQLKISQLKTNLFETSSKITTTLQLANQGSHFIAPYLSLELKDVSEKTLQNISIPHQTILSNTQQTIEETIDIKNILPGKYTLQFKAQIGDKEIFQQISFYYIPKTLLLWILITSPIAIYFLFRLASVKKRLFPAEK